MGADAEERELHGSGGVLRPQPHNGFCDVTQASVSATRPTRRRMLGEASATRSGSERRAGPNYWRTSARAASCEVKDKAPAHFPLRPYGFCTQDVRLLHPVTRACHQIALAPCWWVWPCRLVGPERRLGKRNREDSPRTELQSAGGSRRALAAHYAGSVKRLEATKRIEGLLARVVSGEGSYLPRVREVWIFGSYARGALDVGDVDLAVKFDQTDDEAGRWFATLMAGGFDHLAALRRELRGTQRALEIHFNELEDLRKEGSSHGCCGGAATRSKRRTLDLRP